MCSSSRRVIPPPRSLHTYLSVFPTRGDSDQDRSFRHPRRRADKKAKTTTTTEVKVKKELPITTTTTAHLIRGGPSDFFKPPKLENDWTLLPSVDVVVDGINTFTRNYYQLGFIPKKRFPRQVRDNPSSMSAFLLLSILAISARFDGTLRGGDGLDAAAEFMRKAQFLAVHELYQQPTLERCQAFYLLSIAEQGCGKSNTSYVRYLTYTLLPGLLGSKRQRCNVCMYVCGSRLEKRSAQVSRSEWLL